MSIREQATQIVDTFRDSEHPEDYDRAINQIVRLAVSVCQRCQQCATPDRCQPRQAASESQSIQPRPGVSS
jgi:hypothetical protein